MNRMTPILAVAIASAGSAYAAGPTPVVADQPIAPAPVPVYTDTSGDWAGGYAGVQLGYGTGDFSTNLNDYDSDGVIGGFHAGYNWDLGNWIFGPELQYDFTDLDIDSGSGSGTFDEIVRLNLRVGRDLGRGLLYGSAGIAYANFDGVSGAISGDLDDSGYVLGLGYDYRLNGAWTIGGQYQYHEFDDFGADGNDVDFGTLHLRASYNF